MPIQKFELEMLETVEETLINMYEQLGWKRKEELDPRQYTINKKQWIEVADQLAELEPGGALLFMNVGPKGKEDVPYGKIKIENRRK